MHAFLAYPFVRAETVESAEELLAGSEILTTGVDALVVINIVLPAVLGLVGVREAA